MFPVLTGFHVFWENFIRQQHGDGRSLSLSGCYNLLPVEQNETRPNIPSKPPRSESFFPGGREKLSLKQASEENRIKTGKNWEFSATCRNTETGTFLTKSRFLGTFSSGNQLLLLAPSASQLLPGEKC